MANYSLVINSKFRPFTYDELMKPVHDSTVAHQEVEAAYGALDTQASKWEHMANQATDEKAYTMYKTYADDLRAQADNLARNGLNALSRKDLLTMQRRYAQEITPIENAYTRRAALADEQRKLSQQDVSLRFQKDAATMSLDDFIDNPMLDYGKSYSGAALEKQAGEAAASLAKGLREYAITGTSDPYTNAFVLKYGYTPERIAKFLSDFENPDSPNHDAALAQILESVIDTSGVRSWNDEAALDEAYSWASRGLLKAIGESKVNPMENFKARTDYSVAAKARATGEVALQDHIANNVSRHAIFSQKEMNNHKRIVNKFNSRYFNKNEDGKYVLTKAGRTALESGDLAERYEPSASIFKATMKQLGITASMTDDEINNAWEKYVNKFVVTPDTMEYSEYQFAPVDSERKTIREAHIAAINSGDKVLNEVDFNSETGQFDKTGKTLSIEDLKKKDYLPSIIYYGRYGNTVLYTSKDGDTVLVEEPIVDIDKYHAAFDKKDKNGNGTDGYYARMAKIEASLQRDDISDEAKQQMIQEYNNIQLKLHADMAGTYRTNTSGTYKYD
jgi:hypothetical protein